MINKEKRFLLKARLTPGKCGFIQVFEEIAEKTFECIWEFMPKRNNPPICYLKQLSSSEFLMIDQNGGIGRYEINQQKELAYATHKTPVLSGYGVTPDQKTGYYCYSSPENGSVTIVCFNTENLIQTNQIEMDHFKTMTHLTALSDQQLIGYIPAKDSTHRDFRDGCVKVNLETGETETFYLEFPPSGNYPPPPIAFCSRLNLGARPSYEPIEIEETKGEKRYLAKIVLFSLSNGDKVRNIVARSFRPENLFEDDNPSYALSCLQLPPLSEEYRDIRDEFLERFEKISFCHTEDTLWVTFQHGLACRIDLAQEQKNLSIGVPCDEQQPPENPYVRSGFNTPLSLSEDDVFLSFGEPEVTFAIKDLKLEKAASPLVLKHSICDLNPGSASLASENAFSWNIIQIEEIDGAPDDTGALERLLHLSEDLDNLRDGNLLRFRFNYLGETLSEEEFFQKLTTTDKNIKLIEGFLNNLIAFPYTLWLDSTTPAGMFAMRNLVLYGIAHLDLFQSYISIIKENTEANRLKPLINETILKYGWQPKTIDLLLTYASFHPQQGVDFLQESLDSQELKSYLTIKENNHYLQSHSLFMSLSNEYFSLLHPVEDQLFTAIEQENASSVSECLSQPIELELHHPDFQMSALEMACDIENLEIVNLLIEKGADVSRLMKQLDVELSGSDQSLIHQQDSFNLRVNELKEQRESLQAEIFKIEFDNMLSLSSISKEGAENLSDLNEELMVVKKQIKMLNLLNNINSQVQINKSPKLPGGLDHKNKRLTTRSDSFIDDHSYAYEDIKAATIYIENLDDEGISAAFEQMIHLSTAFSSLIRGNYLRISFFMGDITLTEEEFSQQLEQKSFDPNLLHTFFKRLIETIENPLWYDDETPACFHLLRPLVLCNKKYISIFIQYLNSEFFASAEEPPCVTDFIFEIYDQFGWCEETFELIVSRICNRFNQNGFGEFRIQFKKGGLKEILAVEETYELFMSIAETQANNEDKLEEIGSIISRLSDSSS